jgi:hypothetical protein
MSETLKRFNWNNDAPQTNFLRINEWNDQISWLSEHVFSKKLRETKRIVTFLQMTAEIVSCVINFLPSSEVRRTPGVALLPVLQLFSEMLYAYIDIKYIFYEKGALYWVVTNQICRRSSERIWCKKVRLKAGYCRQKKHRVTIFRTCFFRERENLRIKCVVREGKWR